MAGAWISACSATSLSRVPAYPFRLSTWAAASRIRSLVRADLELTSSASVTSCFLGTRQTIGARIPPARPGRRQGVAQHRTQRKYFYSYKIVATGQVCADPQSRSPFLPQRPAVRLAVHFGDGQPAQGRGSA